jgi:hypothetical protein
MVLREPVLGTPLSRSHAREPRSNQAQPSALQVAVATRSTRPLDRTATCSSTATQRPVADLRRYVVAGYRASARRPRECAERRRSNCQSRLTTRAKNSRPYAGAALGPASADSCGTRL